MKCLDVQDSNPQLLGSCGPRAAACEHEVPSFEHQEVELFQAGQIPHEALHPSLEKVEPTLLQSH